MRLAASKQASKHKAQSPSNTTTLIGAIRALKPRVGYTWQVQGGPLQQAHNLLEQIQAAA